MTGSSRREDGEAVSFFRRQLLLAAVAGGVVLGTFPNDAAFPAVAKEAC